MIKSFLVVEEYNETEDIYRNINKFVVLENGNAVRVSSGYFAELAEKFNLIIKSRESEPDAEGFRTIATEYIPM